MSRKLALFFIIWLKLAILRQRGLNFAEYKFLLLLLWAIYLVRGYMKYINGTINLANSRLSTWSLFSGRVSSYTWSIEFWCVSEEWSFWGCEAGLLRNLWYCFVHIAYIYLYCFAACILNFKSLLFGFNRGFITKKLMIRNLFFAFFSGGLVLCCWLAFIN